jgi:predicted enzyme related to lactoylglutathione lyase
MSDQVSRGNSTVNKRRLLADWLIHDFATVGQIPRYAGCYPSSIMEAKSLTPILNVSDIASTVAWFEKWGWKKLWDWGTPPTFGAVGSGKEACIFLCQGAQGGRGRGANTTTFQQDGDEEGDKGVWMSVWVDDVDEMHKHCVAAGLEVTFPPTDMPWNVREMHLRHPDGHVFRVGRGFEPKK